MTFQFLNDTRRIPGDDWSANGASYLWRYNLHYFDDLNAEGADGRRSWHEQAMENWIKANSPGTGTGWEPYPSSLRIVNWIKYALAGAPLSEPAMASLAMQARLLCRRLEYHLLGNHLFANAKALVFAGAWFAGSEADKWLRKGGAILEKEIREQILPDGGHFERSPMYHSLVLEDVLDMINLARVYPHRRFSDLEALTETAGRMLAWLDAMTHPDGEISFFNDASSGIAPKPGSLKEYAERLGVTAAGALRDLQASGYARFGQGPWTVFYDAAPVGPDYQPGHAHADTLAFELSADGERLISNSGTSTYEPSAQRDFERSTRAHNTVELDRKDSSEVWASFRVARRAKPFDRRVELLNCAARAECAHDGYSRLPGQPIHRRLLEVTPNSVRWTDSVEGAGSHRAKGFIPLHPGVQPSIQGRAAQLRTPRGKSLILEGKGITIFSLEEGSYAREFGVIEPRPVLVWELTGAPPLEASFTLRFGP